MEKSPAMEKTGDLIFITENNNYTLDMRNITLPIRIQLTMYRVLLPTMGFFVMSLNLAVVVSCYLIIKRGQQPKSTYMFLGNVAFSDFILGLFMTFGQSYPNAGRSQLSCSLALGIMVGCTLVSLYTVALIAVDRFIYIVHGINYQRWMYSKRVKWLIFLTWIIGMTTSFTPTMGWRKENSTENGKVCWYAVLASNEALLLTAIVGCIPIVLVCIMYSIILYYAIKKSVQLKKMSDRRDRVEEGPTKLRAFRGGSTQSNYSLSSNSNSTDHNSNRIFYLNANVFDNNRQNDPSKWKAVKVVGFTTGGFVITWVAYFVASLLYVWCDPNKTLQKCQGLRFALSSPLTILGFSNCLLNPIIYAWWHEGFRKSVKKILCKSKSRYNREVFALRARVNQAES